MSPEIDRLVGEVSLERLVEARGVALRAEKDRLVGTCPFHPRAKPKLRIDPSTNSWSCVLCKLKTGTVVDWTMRAEGVSRKHAIELLRSDHVVGTGTAEKLVKKSSVKKLGTFVEADTDDDGLLARVVGYYHDALKTNPKALAFLAENGIKDGDILARFKVGFSDRTLGYRLPDKNRQAGAEVRGRLQRLGILKESGHEHLRGCITVPIYDDAGKLVSVYGHRVHLDRRKAETPDVFLGDVTKGVFNIEAFTASKDIVVTASVFESMAAWCSGVKNVTAAWGVDGFSADHLAAVERHKTERVFIMFPRTAEGDTAAKKLADKLAPMGVEVMRVLLPSGMNVIEYLGTSSNRGLGQLVQHAEWVAGVRAPSSVTELPTPEPALPRIVTEGSSDSATPATPEASSETADITLTFGDRTWRVRGLSKNVSYETLRVNLFVTRETNDPRTSGFFVDNIELYSARQRGTFVEQAAEELLVEQAVVKADLGHVLLHLEQVQDRHIKAALEPKPAAPEMTEADRAEALVLLRDPHLFDRVVADFEKVGVVGETTNVLVGYLATISRKLEDPLAILVQSSSAAGKSSLMDAVLAFVPDEDKVEFSAMTGQALYYIEPGALRHRVLAISEEAGAERASYALKLLQSEGGLTIASTAKESGTGRLVTHEYRVTGPVALMMTTTATVIDDELQNRCVVLSVDEGTEQTRAIHRRQRERETLEGLLARHQRDRIVGLHRNAQRLLRPLVVVNPFAPTLTFADGTTRSRRDHRKYLTLIRAIALVHQHQRTVKQVMVGGVAVEYVEVERSDVELADKLMADVLGRTTDDLPPHTRQVLGLLEAFVSAECNRQSIAREDFRFSRREVREHLGIGGTQLWVHLRRLVDAEYLVVHPSRHGRGVVFELACTTPIVRPSEAVVRGSFGADSGDVRGAGSGASPEEASGNGTHRSTSAATRHRPDERNGRRSRSPENGAG